MPMSTVGTTRWVADRGAGGPVHTSDLRVFVFACSFDLFDLFLLVFFISAFCFFRFRAGLMPRHGH